MRQNLIFSVERLGAFWLRQVLRLLPQNAPAAGAAARVASAPLQALLRP